MTAHKVALQPGWLVINDTHIHGCTNYTAKNRREHRMGARLEGEWETEKTVIDVDEQKAVYKAGGQVIGCIAKVGYYTVAGTFVPYHKEAELTEALIQARQILHDYNATAKHTRLAGDFIVLQITGDNSVVAESIWRRVRDAMDDLDAAIESADVKKIRRTLTNAKRIDEMLPAAQAQHLRQAFDGARKIATVISKSSDGLDSALSDLQDQMKSVDTARLMFVESVDTTEDGTRPNVLPPLNLPSVDVPNVEMAAAPANEEGDRR